MSTGPTLTGRITLADETGGALASIQGNVDSTFKTIGNSADEAQKKVSASTMDVVKGFSGLATSAYSLYMGFDRLQSVQLQSDKANLAVQRSTEAAKDAQERYNQAVAKYGADSPQAVDAANKLTIAQEALRVSSEKAEIAQNNVGQSTLGFALTVVPSAITMMTNLTTLSGSWTAIMGGVTAAQHALNAAMAANPVGIIVVSIAALVAILVVAYQTCEPFRNAINAIGDVLKTVLLGAIEAVIGALTWFWDVLTNNPLASFIKSLLGIGNSANQAASATAGAADSMQGSMDAIGDAAQSSGVAVDSAMSGMKANASDASKSVASSMSNISASAQNAVADLGGYMGQALAEAQASVEKIRSEMQKVETAEPGGNLATPDYPMPTQQEKPPVEEPVTEKKKTTTSTTTTTVVQTEEASKSAKSKTSYAMQHGGEGIVRRPTLFLAGETGPEYFSFKPISGGGGTGNNITVQGPLVVIEGSADRATAELAARLVEEKLRSVLLEVTSSSAPAASRRIRFGSVFS